VLIALGKDPIYVMGQLGHTDPAFTLRVYAHMMRRNPQEREALRGLVEGEIKAHKRLTTPFLDPQEGRGGAPEPKKNPRVSRGFPPSGRPDLNRGPHRPE
jgi:hypothetical protein